MFIGISHGGQAVLHLLVHHPDCADAALVSGASIHPPNDDAAWEMPHMPTSQEWLDLMTEDVTVMGLENARRVQTESFAFTFQPPLRMLPVLVLTGEQDIAMVKRDFQEVVQKAICANEKNRSFLLEHAWHNHSIDIPERFAKVIDD